LRGEHADRRRVAADAHALLALAVDDRRLAGFDDDCCAAIDRKLDRFLVAQIEQCLAGDAPFRLRTAGQMVHAAERQHLGAIFTGRHMADRLARRTHGRGLRAEMAVGVDLHLDAAIAEDALGHDRDEIDTLDLLADDERRGLVVGIGRAGADRSDERPAVVDQAAIPVFGIGCERHGRAALVDRMFQDDQRVKPHDAAVPVAVAVTGAATAVSDVAHHRTGIAADLLADLPRAGLVCLKALGEFAHDRFSCA